MPLHPRRHVRTHSHHTCTHAFPPSHGRGVGGGKRIKQKKYKKSLKVMDKPEGSNQPPASHSLSNPPLPPSLQNTHTQMPLYCNGVCGKSLCMGGARINNKNGDANNSNSKKMLHFSFLLDCSLPHSPLLPPATPPPPPNIIKKKKRGTFPFFGFFFDTYILPSFPTCCTLFFLYPDVSFSFFLSPLLPTCVHIPHTPLPSPPPPHPSPSPPPHTKPQCAPSGAGT